MESNEIIKKLREETGLNRKEFAEHFEIPLRTVEDWEAGRRKPPEYLPRLITYQIKFEELRVTNHDLAEQENSKGKRNVNVIRDLEGNKIVLINDIFFKGKRSVKWKDVRTYLKRYVGEFYSIADTNDIIYIGKDFPMEYSGSKYSSELKGTNAKAKANAAQGIPELVEIAKGKHYRENKNEKHIRNAKYGWYRYDSRFAIPVFDSMGQIERYNVFHASMLVRYANDGKMYLYDIIDIKKETSNSLKSKDST